MATIFRVKNISSARSQRASRWQARRYILEDGTLQTTDVKTSTPTKFNVFIMENGQ
jgi:hypothetical protein